jgi:hypothetical protein
MPNFFPKTLAAAALSVALAFTGMAASTTAARADNDNLHRFLGGAAALLIIGNILENQQQHPGYYGHVPPTRHVIAPPVVHRLVAPSTCYSRFRGPNMNMRGFGAHCLTSHTPHYAYLPNSCLERVFTYQGWRQVYDAQCLYDHGWVRS